MTEGELLAHLPELLKRYPPKQNLGSHFYLKIAQDALKSDNPQGELERAVAAVASS